MYIGIDLGSTNIKAAIYDQDLKLIDRQSRPVQYIRENGLVEFDVCTYYQELTALIGEMVSQNGISRIAQIAFTGQAESLVVLDKAGKPLMNAISWMDERSVEECAELAEKFPTKVCESVTGQLAVLPTWPATKILWLKHHCPEVYENADCYMLLKDYIVYCLTGQKKADMSIATFSFYFDIYNKTYWKEMLQTIGISESQLPDLCEPCTVIGNLLPHVAQALHLDTDTQVNIGTLDHFAGMIGTGNIGLGGITLSTGTVMALATMAEENTPKNTGIAMHYGFLPDTRIMLPVAESGGVSLEWFRRSCMPNTDYDEMNTQLAQRGVNDLLFLPYLVGTNAPEFDADAKGVFWGLRQGHDAIDMAGAVMEGVAFVLRKNCEHIAAAGVTPTKIIATGGGSKSSIWCQMQADITGIPVSIPAEKEAACLGAAMIAAVGNNRYADFYKAADKAVKFAKVYEPHPHPRLETKYHRFQKLYKVAVELTNIV